MTADSRRIARLPRIPLAILALAVAGVIVSQLLPRASTPSAAAARPAAPLSSAPAALPSSGTGAGAPGLALDPVAGAGGVMTTPDLERIRADVKFWGDRFAKSPVDFISATRLATSEVELARATGDISAYLAASAAVDGALKAYPDYPIALDYRGVVLVALHHFIDARADSSAILADSPDDPTALATLGDASLELGDLAAARSAYQKLTAVDDSAAARVRRGHLAFIEGHTDEAVSVSRAAVDAANAEDASGNALAFYHYQLGDTLIGTGDRAGAAKAYAAALVADPRYHLAHWGLARVAAADGHLDEAIAQLDQAIAIVPLPEFAARRADLYRMRGADGDAAREANDRRTVLVIAQLSGAAANVYDRTLSLYLAGSGNDPARALSLAQGEIAIRKDVYGYDALAWALLANDRPVEADSAMTTALAFGTRDAKLLYHAGMIKATLGDNEHARGLLTEALDLDASFDPLAATLARTKLAELP